jgi:ATP-dependent exoDNAse (exonuclease V) alpha subunit
VLRDLLAAGSLPMVRLTKIFRQAQQSGIVVNAHRINAGAMPTLTGSGDFFWFSGEDGSRRLRLWRTSWRGGFPRNSAWTRGGTCRCCAPAVVLPMTTASWMMLQRNLLYTGVTRAKKLVLLVGSRRALAVAVRTKGSGRRHTALAYRLRGA